MIAKVVVDVAADREFDYLIPESLAGQVQLGSRVNLTFGSRTTQGYVVGLSEHSSHPKLKPLISVVGNKPYIAPHLLKLARWMADYYCAPVELAVQAILPGAVRKQAAKFKEQLFVQIQDPGFSIPDSRSRMQVDVPSLQSPESSILNPVSGILPPTTNNRQPTTLSPKQAAVMAVLQQLNNQQPTTGNPETTGLFLSDLIKQADVDAATVRALEKKGLVRISKQASLRDPFANYTLLRTQPLPLMPEQLAALETVRSALDAAGPCGKPSPELPAPHQPLPINHSPPPLPILLHGVTGSGKTEVYLQAIGQVLAKGQGAIVLVPEIALTPQTIERFRGRFGDIVAVLHSHLSDGERHDEWHRIHGGEARIVVGARSAIFAPVGNLGLIVVDEEHEHTYKQEEAPRYNARDVAVMRGHLEGCVVVLGSATPALESFHNARTGKYRLVEMMHRVDHRVMPAMRIVDMRVEAERTGKVSVFSGDLIAAVKARLAKAEQVMLFLNRRGYASSLVCPKCGQVMMCTDCSVAMTYHRQDETLKCHICGRYCPVPARCPGCQDPAFKFAGIGTQRVEVAVGKLFPGARVSRMDADATRGKDAHARILGEFRTGKIDILIGTQMIAKGLDFPNVTLIGVLNADMSLHMPDFRAGERTFQLLTQVAGRAGRGEIPGEVIVQTYTPFHQAIQAARRLDYDGFCDQEFEFRRELSYPPFSHLACLGIQGKDQERVRESSERFVEELRARMPEQVEICGPSPAPLERAKGVYRLQVIFKAPSSRRITSLLKPALKDFRWPSGIAASLDVDAVSLI